MKYGLHTLVGSGPVHVRVVEFVTSCAVNLSAFQFNKIAMLQNYLNLDPLYFIFYYKMCTVWLVYMIFIIRRVSSCYDKSFQKLVFANATAGL